MNAENRDTISRMVPIKSEFARKDIPLAATFKNARSFSCIPLDVIGFTISRSAIPAVVLRNSPQSLIREALSEKPQGYLLKPIAREKLLSTIQSIIQ